MKASIIIPSYNASERLFLNLTALNSQTYYRDDVEVIVIDNGSMDNTLEMLKRFKLKFPMSVVRVEKNKGIAHGRNQGILKSKGEILIFHDSDMIAPQDFIDKHLKYHEAGYDVVCGLFWRRIYSYYYPGFNQQQIEDFKRYGMRLLPHKNFKPTSQTQLLSEGQVAKGQLLDYSFDLDLPFIRDLRSVLAQYGRTFSGYYLPWRFFITNNLSVVRRQVFNVGLFDEKIVRYGYEDYDLGIRLYKGGCKFILADDIVSLHQEHPANYYYKDIFENVLYILNKYDNIYFMDMLLVCLNEAIQLDSDELNLVMGDIYRMLPMEPYLFLVELLKDLLQVVKNMHYNPTEMLPQDIVERTTRSIPQILEKCGELLREHHLNHFVKLLEQVLKATLKIDLGPPLKMASLNS